MTRTYPERPFVGVGAIVFRDEKVLLIKRGKPPRAGSWSLPGGVQLVGETVAEAAAREAHEETGIEIDVVEVVAVVDSITRDPDGLVQYHYTLVDLRAEWRSGEAIAGDDAADARWFHLMELESLGLWRETIRVIRLAAEQRGETGSRPRIGGIS